MKKLKAKQIVELLRDKHDDDVFVPEAKTGSSWSGCKRLDIWVMKKSWSPVTMIGYDLPVMIGGSVITEQIFNLPGMGRLFINAIQTRDYPVVSALMLIFGSALVLINVIVDITYALLDPRIHYK